MLALDRKQELLTELLLADLNAVRLQVSAATAKQTKSSLGQFFTDFGIALMMSNMFEINESHVKLLDPGAGIGILTSALVSLLCNRANKPSTIEIIAVELDERLLEHLQHNLEFCNRLCKINHITFSYKIVHADFIEYGAKLLRSHTGNIANKVIMNPPYKKINSKEQTRRTLRELGVETSNLYTAFVSVAQRLLATNGELVAITPRSFCNGTYFRSFRADFLGEMGIRKIHLFDSRSDAFKDDDVLQENIIYHAVKGNLHDKVAITSSAGLNEPLSSHIIDYDVLVQPGDLDQFIRILLNESDIKIKQTMNGLTHSLQDLGLNVSTGKVVDFRTVENLRNEPEEGSVPLIYPVHFREGQLQWPVYPAYKPNAILMNEATQKMLVPRGNYVLIRRFSAKEEKRRIMPAIVGETDFSFDFIGFENHVNFFHINGRGLPMELAKGMAIYLSSSLVDRYFRQFNGHTQVNVGDLKSLTYPSIEELIRMGGYFAAVLPEQQVIDQAVDTVLGFS